jgi:dTDP-4-amino-4,6-dideoxygalactose transaminase
MPAIAAIARKKGAVVIEDACHALGSTYSVGDEDIPVGSCRHSDMAVFSFHPVKAITAGEGGAITTNDAHLHQRLKLLRSHGMTREPAEFENADLAFGADGKSNPWYYEMPEVGFNYRSSDINCALGLSQLNKLDHFIARRRTLVAIYDRLLARLAPAILPPRRVADCNPAWHLYALRIQFQEIGVARGALMRHMQAAGIGTQVHYIPVHRQPYYRRLLGELQLPGAMNYYRRTLSLPLYPGMADDDVASVVDALEQSVAPLKQ